MITITINQLPVGTFSYYQWFLLGLNELQNEGKLKLKYKVSFLDRFALLWNSSKWVAGVLRRLIYYFDQVPRYNLIGEVEYGSNKRSFTMDCKDSPFIFTEKLLKQCDVYFKLQCPKSIEEDGFEIMPSVRVPYMDIQFGENDGENSVFSRRISTEVYRLRDKIYPGMIGPRRLAWGCRYRDMKKQYEKYLECQSVNKEKKLMAYFGSTDAVKGAKKSMSFDLDWEPDLITYLSQYNSSHPNKKRAQAVSLINAMGDGYDGRLIHELVNGKEVVHRDQVVPLRDFCDFIAQFEYNLNISGYRLSIPNRFIESFIGGTAIITDKLQLKWYQPFGKEVVETAEMGYLPNEDVDWDKFKEDIRTLPPVDKEVILKAYQEKWSPTAFATYVVNTVIGEDVI